MFHPKQETGRDSGGSDYFQVGHSSSRKRHLSCMAAESLSRSLSLPVVKVVCEHSRRSKGFWQETDGAVKTARYSHSLPLYLFNGSLHLISRTVVKSKCAGRQVHSLPYTSGIKLWNFRSIEDGYGETWLTNVLQGEFAVWAAVVLHWWNFTK